MTGKDEAVLTHHQPAAAMWGRGGRHYDEVSFAISDALAHAAQRLNARAGERVLDVATGTGWSARNVARTGASVTAIDISEELLAAARELSRHVHPPIDYRVADVERLPFEDGAFDGIISTFGAMFAIDQPRTAAELARVCRPGGRLALTAWTPEGAVADFFRVIAQHSDGPVPVSSPLAWGDPARVGELLGKRLRSAVRTGREQRLPRQHPGDLGLVRARLRPPAPARREPAPGPGRASQKRCRRLPSPLRRSGGAAREAPISSDDRPAAVMITRTVIAAKAAIRPSWTSTNHSPATRRSRVTAVSAAAVCV